jgi:ribosome-associated translation inhibitor RaiA
MTGPGQAPPRRIEIEGDIPRGVADDAERELAKLERHAGDRPIRWERVTLRRGPGRSKRPFVADALVLVDGRAVAAHADGESAPRAVKAVVEELDRQIRERR